MPVEKGEKEVKEGSFKIGLYLTFEQKGLMDKLIDNKEYMNPQDLFRKLLIKESKEKGLM